MWNCPVETNCAVEGVGSNFVLASIFRRVGERGGVGVVAGFRGSLWQLGVTWRRRGRWRRDSVLPGVFLMVVGQGQGRGVSLGAGVPGDARPDFTQSFSDPGLHRESSVRAWGPRARG